MGEVSSGIHSHNLGKGIGMGFVDRRWGVGDELVADNGKGKHSIVRIVQLPFVPTK